MATLSDATIKVHKPEMRLDNPVKLVTGLVADLIRSRHIAFEMLKRDLKGQYRTSILGFLIPLLPALTTAAWAILFRDAHLINVGNLNMPYPFRAVRDDAVGCFSGSRSTLPSVVSWRSSRFFPRPMCRPRRSPSHASARSSSTLP